MPGEEGFSEANLLPVLGCLWSHHDPKHLFLGFFTQYKEQSRKTFSFIVVDEGTKLSCH